MFEIIITNAIPAHQQLRSSPEHSPPLKAPYVREMQAGFPQTNHKAVAGPLLLSYWCAALGVICVPLVGSGFLWVLANEGFCRRIEPNGIS